MWFSTVFPAFVSLFNQDVKNIGFIIINHFSGVEHCMISACDYTLIVNNITKITNLGLFC